MMLGPMSGPTSDPGPKKWKKFGGEQRRIYAEDNTILC